MARRAIIKWMPGQAYSEMNRVAALRLSRAGEALRAQIVRNISIPTRRGSRGADGRYASQGAGPSKPGEFPHADTGKLRQSIFATQATPNHLEVIVGTNLIYGRVHEIKRSFLRRTLYEMWNRLKRIAERGGGRVETE